MANEIKELLQVLVNNGGYAENFTQNVNVTQNTPGANGGILSVLTTGVNLPVGGVTTNGVLCLSNLDATNYIDYGVVVSSTFYPVGRVKAGEPSILRLTPGVTLRLVANTATVNVQFLLLND